LVNENKTDEFLYEKDNVKDFVNVKLNAFLAFARQLNPSFYKDEADYFWVKNDEDKGISILGLNSAWASEGDNDRCNIALGYRQVLDALKESKHIPNRVVLMHHPPVYWLKDFETG
jgi:hypothetical protein